MKFHMWSGWHFLLIAAPVLIFAALYFLLRNKSYRVRYGVGLAIGVVSLAILIVRNVDIWLRVGFDPEIIPLQVCHFGNIAVFLALAFKSKVAAAMAWSLNMAVAFCALIFADSLANYANILTVRAQAYVWGHIFIVVGSLYAVVLKIVPLEMKSFLYAALALVLLLVPSIILNSYFNDVLGMNANYFYIYNAEGVPFGFLEIGVRARYGWFTINWFYTLSLFFIFLVAIFGIFVFGKYVVLKEKRARHRAYSI